MEQQSTFDVVGKSFPRKDGVARVTGKERYTCTDGGSSSCRLVRRNSFACESATGVLDPQFGVARRNSLYVRNPVNEVV